MNESQALLKLVSLGLGNTDVSHYEAEEWLGVDWSELMQLARRQGLTAIVSDGVNLLVSSGKLNLERKAFIEWIQAAVKSEQVFTLHKSSLSSLASIYAENDIKLLILKGYSLAANYPEPRHRPSGDIDIYLFGRQKEGDEVIKSRGIRIRNDYHHHSVFDFKGAHIENHFDFLNIHSQKSNIPFEKKLKSLADKGYLPSDIDNAYIPSPDFNALFILRHTAAHFAAVEMILRQVVDWGTFVQKNGNCVDWDSTLSFIRQSNMYDFLYCINTICTEYLGFPKHIFPVMEGSHDLAERILNDMLTPEFDELKPESGLIRMLLFKIRRWKANVWKQKIVYSDSRISLFLNQLFSHLQKPKTFMT